MANHATATFRKPVNDAVFWVMFNAINAARFDAYFQIDEEITARGQRARRHDNLPRLCHWTFSAKPDNPEIGEFGVWLHPSGRKLEWRHPADTLVAWWAQEYFVSLAIAILKLDATIRDEGIDETMKPNYFKKYPRLTDWIKGMTRMAPPVVAEGIISCLPERTRQCFG